MNLRTHKTRLLTAPILLTLALVASPTVLGCAVCFGRSDSPLAEGMNMGILSLLGVIVGVLGAFTAFFVFLGRRAAGVRDLPSPPPGSPTVDSSWKI